MTDSLRKTRDLVLVGGGHSHVLVLKYLASRPVAGLRTTVVSREVLTPYSGMLPGYVAGHYGWRDIHIDLAPLCAAAGARLISGAAVGLDLAARRIACTDRPPVRFDVLSINVGAAPATGQIHGADRFGIPVKPINRFVPHWHALLDRVKARPEQRTKIAIVGGGAGGVELGLAMDHRFRVVEGFSNVDMILVSAAPRLVADQNPRSRKLLMKELGKRHFDVHLGARVIAVEDGFLETDVDGKLDVDEVLWVTQAAPQSWPAEAGLVADSDGFIVVNDKLQSLADPEVFAAGDIATIDGQARPKAGVFAVRQGKILAENLCRKIRGEELRVFRPQERYLALISTGARRAVAIRGNLAVAGRWVWRWKDWIDRRFMAQFAGLARSVEPTPFVTEENLGRDLLLKVFQRLNLTMPAEALTGVGADAALLRPVVNSLEVQSICSLGEMPFDRFTLGRVGAAHALNEILAVGGVPRTALVSISLPPASEDCIEDDLFQLLSGIVVGLDPVGASVIVANARVTATLSINAAVTGTVDESDVLNNRRVSIDDVLILTKPVGSGILLAAARDARCRSDWLFGATASMQKCQLEALTILRAAGLRSCAAVSASGVLGKVTELIGACRLSVELWPEHVPCLDGALGLVAAYPPAFAPEGIDFGAFSPGDPRVQLLGDAQVAGGLLATIRPDKVVQCLSALRDRGYAGAAVIGRIRPQSADAPSCTLTTPGPG